MGLSMTTIWVISSLFKDASIIRTLFYLFESISAYKYFEGTAGDKRGLSKPAFIFVSFKENTHSKHSLKSPPQKILLPL
jgi:hypothetical protein